jgi:hypothetical protein
MPSLFNVLLQDSFSYLTCPSFALYLARHEKHRVNLALQPNLVERAARAADRIVVRQWHSGNITICPRALAGQTAEQVPSTPAGIHTDYIEIPAALDPLVPHASRYYDDVTGFHNEFFAFSPPNCSVAVPR